MVRKKEPTALLREKLLEAAISAADRLKLLLDDENAANGDVIKAAALALEMANKGNEGAVTGDYEILVKEE